jgi:hypothetical protein
MKRRDEPATGDEGGREGGGEEGWEEGGSVAGGREEGGGWRGWPEKEKRNEQKTSPEGEMRKEGGGGG